MLNSYKDLVIKKVPLDFKYPIGQIWKGYYCPKLYIECKACENAAAVSEDNVACEFCKDEKRYWYSEEAKRLYGEWHPYEPPSGDAFQVWSELHLCPVSPVFKTILDCANWCHENVVPKGSLQSWLDLLVGFE